MTKQERLNIRNEIIGIIIQADQVAQERKRNPFPHLTVTLQITSRPALYVAK